MGDEGWPGWETTFLPGSQNIPDACSSHLAQMLYENVILRKLKGDLNKNSYMKQCPSISWIFQNHQPLIVNCIENFFEEMHCLSETPTDVGTGDYLHDSLLVWRTFDCYVQPFLSSPGLASTSVQSVLRTAGESIKGAREGPRSHSLSLFGRAHAVTTGGVQVVHQIGFLFNLFSSPLDRWSFAYGLLGLIWFIVLVWAVVDG